MTLFLVSAGAAAVVGLALFLGFRWLTGRAMFEPGTVAERARAAGEPLDPPGRTADRFRVTEHIELAHDTFGAGVEHLLFVHGGPGFPPRGRPRALEIAARKYTVHLYHQRGVGGSTRPFARAPEGSFYEQLVAVESKLGLAAQIADIERIRRSLERERLVLVGHSFGALVAALYAAEFPDRVRALVLVSPAPLHVMPGDVDLFALVRGRLPDADRAAFDDYMRSYFDLPAAMALDEGALSRHYGRLRSFYARAAGMAEPENGGDAGGFMTLATYASLGRRHDWRDALRRVTAPAVVIHGRSDMAPESATRDFASTLSRAEVVVVDAAHFALDEAAEPVAAAIDRAVGMAR
ncbi:alpha/beta hydrolase [Sorangium sp. So ce1335]|uniref:alpha/beta hydrolase n=1 Tax=Sorangium sp. So ce1335 TaxID=3133335 RepID=UPI003F5DAC35